MFGFLVGATGMFATMYSTQAILPVLSRAFRVSPSLAGLSISVTVLLVAAGAWLWGAYSDRHGRRHTILLASGLLVLPTVALAAVPDFALLLVCRAIQGLCMPGLLTVGVPYIREVFSSRHAGRAMGNYVAALVVGGLVGRLGVAFLAAGIGWRAALASLAVLPCAGTVLMWRSLPEAPPSSHTTRRVSAVAGHLRNPHLRRAIAAGSALLFVFIGVFSYVTYRLQAAPFRLGPQTSSLVFLLWVVGAIGPGAGKLSDRWGWRQVGVASLAAAAAGTALTLAPSLPAVIAGLAMLATGMFSGVTVIQLGVAASAEVDRGTASGVYFSCYYAAGALGGYLPGLAWQHWAWPGVALLAVGVLATAAVILAAPLPRQPR
jgi:YNFM family putative membrane transporter